MADGLRFGFGWAAQFWRTRGRFDSKNLRLVYHKGARFPQVSLSLVSVWEGLLVFVVGGHQLVGGGFPPTVSQAGE